MVPTRLQGLGTDGALSQRHLVTAAIDDYEQLEHNAFREVVDGGVSKAAFVKAMQQRQVMAHVLADLGVRADAIHIDDPDYVARAANIASRVQGMTDGDKLHKTINGVFRKACYAWQGPTLFGERLEGLGLKPLNLTASSRKPPLTAKRSVELVKAGREGEAGYCIEIGVRTALLASAMTAFCPDIKPLWITIPNISDESFGVAAHVFVAVGTPSKRIALDSQGISWKYRRTHPYYSTTGRLGALVSWHNNFGLISVTQNAKTEGIALLETAATLHPEDASIHNSLAMGYLNVRRFDAAGQSARRAIALEQMYAPHHYTLALVLAAQEQTDEALRHIESAIAFASGDANVLTMCGRLLGALSRWQEAAEALAGALEVDPEFDKARTALRQLLEEHREIRVRIPPRSGASGGFLDGLMGIGLHVATLGMLRDDDDR